jgi:5-methylcytosine-specific restriction protein A
MPTRPPQLRKQAPRPSSNWDRRKSRQERGYGREHDAMRRIVLDEEPLCRVCLGKHPAQYTPSTIADHIRPKAEGGTDDRDNYQGICDPCHRDKTARESGRSRRNRT